ncbi:hypothetical protein O6H91_15G028400 [Diphasiastrum complanatum]|uniref:Uncharacterized protein n=1 Tax=Diphasiastrum complanatum TaxID=34168 RepID=A0ACC2BGR6_DIPCM|nr:hypothetical protein O6H91_15G028400 [Diphasiastrum complanatum]
MQFALSSFSSFAFCLLKGGPSVSLVDSCWIAFAIRVLSARKAGQNTVKLVNCDKFVVQVGEHFNWTLFMMLAPLQVSLRIQIRNTFCFMQ